MANRREFLVKFTMAASAATILKPLHAFAEFGATHSVSNINTLTLLHTANLQGQWQALGIKEKLYGLGGLENLCKRISKIKSDVPSSLVVHSGDIVSTTTSEKDAIAFYTKMTKAGYSAVVPGRTDLKKGTTHFAQLAKKSGLPAIDTEVEKTGNSLLPYQIVTKGNVQTAVVQVPFFKNTFSSAESLIKTGAFLRETKNCNLIIGIVQNTEQKCVELASLSYGIDVLFSTAENALMHNTKIVHNKNCEEAIVSFAGQKGTMMSRIDLAFDAEGNKIAFASSPIFIGAGKETYSTVLKRYNYLYA